MFNYSQQQQNTGEQCFSSGEINSRPVASSEVRISKEQTYH